MAKPIKKMIAFYLAIIFFVGLDRFFKIFALTAPNRQINLIGEILKFNYQANNYIAFSLPLAGKALTALIFLAIVGLILFSLYNYWRKEYFKLEALFLIVMGASSNLFDRVSHGPVIDYLDLKYFTVFNLADVMIVAGTILLIFVSYKKETA